MYDPQLLYVDPILSGFSVGYKDQNLYGVNLAPITRVLTQSGRYRVFDRSDWLMYLDRREPGTVANEVYGRKWSTDSFSTFEHSLQAPVFDEERQELNSLGGLADPAFGGAISIDPERDAVKLITRSLLLGHELKVSTIARNTANYASGNFTTLAGTAQWDSQAEVTAGIPESVVSDPVADIQTGIRVITGKINQAPNLLMIPRYGVPYIENHPKIINRFKNFSLVQPDAFRLLTGFEGQIVLTDSMYNSADSIDATPSMTQFWGKDVVLAYVDPTDGQNVQTFLKTFSQVYPSGDIRPADRWREEPRKADLFRVSWKYDLKVVSNIAGYLIKTAFSSGAF